MENRELIKILNRYKIFEIGVEQAQSEILALFNVVGQSEQLVCKHCGKQESEHTEASNMCLDRFKHFEAN